MSGGAATDQTRDEAQGRSRNCPHCSGSGQATVYDRDFDGRRVAERDVIVRGEIKRSSFAMVVTAHCVCPMGEWMRSKADRDTIHRIPALLDVLAGRRRWTAQDPMGERPFDPGLSGGGAVRVKDGRVSG